MIENRMPAVCNIGGHILRTGSKLEALTYEYAFSFLEIQ